MYALKIATKTKLTWRSWFIGEANQETCLKKDKGMPWYGTRELFMFMEEEFILKRKGNAALRMICGGKT